MKTDEIWAYWAEVANAAVSEERQADWLAWRRFKAALLGPFEEWTEDFPR